MERLTIRQKTGALRRDLFIYKEDLKIKVKEINDLIEMIDIKICKINDIVVEHKTDNQ